MRGIMLGVDECQEYQTAQSQKEAAHCSPGDSVP